MDAQKVNIPPNHTDGQAGFSSSSSHLGPAAIAGPPFPQTPESARQWFRDRGIRIKDWSARKGLDYQAVKDVLIGRNKGSRGPGHPAAIQLGIKPDPEAAIGNVLTANEAAAMDVAQAAISQLEILGVAVIGIENLDDMPVIAIQHGAATSALGGNRVWTMLTLAGTVDCYIAVYRGCLLRWFQETVEPRVFAISYLPGMPVGCGMVRRQPDEEETHPP